MRDAQTEAWSEEVQDALKHYRRAAELEHHAGLSWPAVQALSSTRNSPVAALRQVLDEAIKQLESSLGAEVRLLRDHYLRGRSIKALAIDYAVDASNLHRRRNRLVQEVAVVIAERNRHAERAARAQRFIIRQPVFGFAPFVTDLVARLCDPAAPAIMVLEGMGGLGKTTLARLIAAEIAANDAFAAVLWTSAKQVEFDVWAGKRRTVHTVAIQPGDILGELARALDIHEARNLAEQRSEVIAHCKRAPYLIVIDNLESIEDMAALGPLMERLAVPSRILITTRDHAPDALPPTLPRHYVTLDELDAPTSFQLLRGAASYLGASELTAATDADLGAIYRVTGGNPLALWLVAGQAQGLPWSAFVADLVAHRPPGSAHELYTYLYRRSWDQLSADARLVLFAMHRCEAGAEYSYLLELSQLERDAFQQAVKELGSRMLLQFDGRYTIHRLTYSFLRTTIAGWEE